MLTVRYGGLRFTSRPVGRSGCVLTAGGFVGWWDGVGVARETMQRSGAHGAFASPGYLQGRVVEMHGRIIAESPREAALLAGRVRALGQSGDYERLTVQEDDEALWTPAGLQSPTKITVKRRGELFHEFSVMLWCPDPYRYGVERVFSGSETVWHRGTAPAWPRLRIDTPDGVPDGYGVRLMQGDRTVAYVRMRWMAAGSSHLIDMATGVVVNEMGRRVRAVHSGAPWAVPPGGEYRVRLEPAVNHGSVRLARLEVTDTWL